MNSTTTTVSTSQLTAAPQILCCKTCNQHKLTTEFNVNSKLNDGTFYPNCRLCAHKNSVEFWGNKQFKFCESCDSYRHISKYSSFDGVPAIHCIKCHAANLTAKRRADKEAAKTGASTANYAWGRAEGVQVGVVAQQPPPASNFVKAVGYPKR
jgi:hypothetical protein